VSEPTIPASALPPEGGEQYAKDMLSRAEGTSPQPQSPPAPEQTLLAGKFENTDELVKAYEELQKKLGAPKPPAEPPKPADAPKPGEPPKVDPTKPNVDIKPPEQAEAEQAQAVVENAGLDWAALNTEWSTEGALKDESYAKLEKAGIPRDMVDQFINGQIAAATLARNEVFTVAGGEEQYGSMIQWAAQNLSAEEQKAYNNIVNGRDMAATKIAVAGLKARFEAINGSAPKLVTGDTTLSTTGYGSVADLKKDMADPRYDTDPAFRKEVENKLRVSSVL